MLLYKGSWNSTLLIADLEIWKGATDNNKAFGALLADLGKLLIS